MNISPEVFVIYMLLAVRDVCPDLDPTTEDKAQLSEQIATATSSQERVNIFHQWLRDMWKAQVTP